MKGNCKNVIINRKVPVVRIMVSVICAACLAGGVFFAVMASRIKREFYQALEDEPIRLKVDISEPNSYTKSFLQSYSAAHGQYLYIETEGVEISFENAADILKGLEGSFLITDSNNSVVIERDINAPGFYDRNVRPNTPSLYFYPFPKGEYNIEFVIKKGAPALAEKDHWLVCRYFLCGLELMSAMILRIISIICFVVGVVLLSVLVVKTRLIHRLKRKEASNPTVGKNSE